MNKSLISIKGIIIPSSWDKDGNILSIKIMTVDEDQFEIEDNDMAGILTDHLRKMVTVSGETAVVRSQKYIRVENYTLHDGFSPS